MPLSSTTATACQWFSHLAAILDPRSAPRLVRLFLGAVLAAGRRTVTSWLRAAGITDEFRPAYTTVAAAGKRTDLIAARLAHSALRPMLAAAERLTFGIDDTPTQRYGPEVEGAGVHHNPTPGPAGSRYVYGHVWVVLGLLARHPAWGTIALPLLARLYVRRKATLPRIAPDHRPTFRTKLELAVELVRWAVIWLGFLGKPLWVVADGAYAKAAFLKPLHALGVTVVSRLRKDAALCSVPGPRRPGRRGRTRIYGEHRIDLAKRAGQRRGWQLGVFDLYGKPTAKKYKTFLATWRPAGGLIRVVLVKEPHGWVAFFCTDPAATVADVLSSVADRFSSGDGVPGREGSRRGRPAAGAVSLGQRRGVPPVPVDLHDDRGVGVGPSRGRIGGPIGLALGRPDATAIARRQAAGVAAATAGRGNPGGSAGRADRGGNRRGRRTPHPMGHLTIMKSRKVQFSFSRLFTGRSMQSQTQYTFLLRDMFCCARP